MLDPREQVRGRPTQPGKERDIYDDVFTKAELEAIFRERKGKFEGLNNKIRDFVELLDDLVDRAYKAKREELIKENQAEKKKHRKKAERILKRYKIIE